MKNKEIVIYDSRQPLVKTILDNIITFMLLAFCAWISQDNTFWTMLTGFLFLYWFYSRMNNLIQERKNIFYSKEELQKWVDSLD